LVSEGHAVPWVLDDRGVSLLNLDRYSGAIANFDAAIRLEPNDAYAYYNRAEAILNSDFHSQPYTIQQFQQHHHLLIFRHLDAALQNLNRGLQINPHDTDAQNLKTLLIEGLRHGYLRGAR